MYVRPAASPQKYCQTQWGIFSPRTLQCLPANQKEEPVLKAPMAEDEVCGVFLIRTLMIKALSTFSLLATVNYVMQATEDTGLVILQFVKLSPGQVVTLCKFYCGNPLFSPSTNQSPDILFDFCLIISWSTKSIKFPQEWKAQLYSRAYWSAVLLDLADAEMLPTYFQTQTSIISFHLQSFNRADTLDHSTGKTKGNKENMLLSCGIHLFQSQTRFRFCLCSMQAAGHPTSH